MSSKVKQGSLAVACVAALAMAAPAQAGGPMPSQVTMKQSQNNEAKFKGKVTSFASECVVGRKVKIYRVEPGDDQKLAKTFASESGKYSVKIPMQSGNKLFARVEQFTPPGSFPCLADDSETVNA